MNGPRALIARRRMLQAGIGLAGGLALPGFGLAEAMAQEMPAKLGTYPDGASGPSIFVGITTPLTGPYSADGKDAQLGYELAIAEINAGSATVAKWGLKDKVRRC
jgi:ABC-type branched-subunit amino acid transport system substrate-binding protein